MNDPLKVLIVDDEPLERNLVKNCINWKYLGMEIAGEASNADEALRLMEKESPEIVFTDIQMPVTDGIQLIEIATPKYPETKFVVLTGYDNFDYAQRSIRLGVSDFLVKPINDEDVFQTASNLKKLIEREKTRRVEYDKLKKQLYDSLPYLKERFCNELLKGGLDDRTAEERMTFLGIQFKYRSFQVAVLAINFSESDNEESRYVQGLNVMEKVRACFLENRHALIFFDIQNRIVILNNDEDFDLLEKCELLKDAVGRSPGCSVGIGVGSLKREPREISVSYQEALDALDYRVAVGKNAVVPYHHIHLNNRENRSNAAELYNKLGIYLKSGLKTEAKEIIGQLLDSVDLENAAAIRRIHTAALEILMICLRNTMDTEMDTEDLYKYEVESLSRIFQIDTLPEIKAHLFRVMENCSQTIGRQQISKIDHLILSVKKYVDLNYPSRELSLSSAAKTFFLNPSYLSRTFKKEAGVSFSEYLTTVRMEKAIRLLMEQDMRSFEIADAVGISDANYFGTCFKKYTGVSVSDYRKSMAAPDHSRG